MVAALQTNSDTGFLEADSPSNYTFSSENKLQAIALANQYISQKTYPVLRDICATIGISLPTFYNHLRNDPKFHEAWQDIKLKINDVFTEHLVLKSKTKTGVIANLAILKYNEAGTWLDQTKINLSTNVFVHKSDVIDAKSYLEAEEIKPVAPVVKPNAQIQEHNASNNVLIEESKHEI